MIEILGNNLKRFFDAIDNPPNDADIIYASNRYEVWEVSDELHKKMCYMSEKEFVELAGEDAWWRSSEGSNLGVPKTKFIVNGEELIGWDKEENLYRQYWHHGNQVKKYTNLSDYLCNGVGASQPKNVCACAMDLAKYNNMTMGELFQKYER